MRTICSSLRCRAFTLVELLAVISIVAILAALLLPTLAAAKDKARKIACLSNLRQTSIAIAGYAPENDGRIPYGPKAPPFSNPADFYPSTGAPTSLISLQNGAPVGLGLLLDFYLADQPKSLFCPGCDQPLDADAQLARVGQYQAQSSYYYRHGGNTLLSDTFANTNTTLNLRLDNLGVNRNGLPIRALVIDTDFLTSPTFAVYGIKNATNHRQRYANILFSDGHALSRPNSDARFTVDLTSYSTLTSAFDRILKVLEQADTEE
jgi:prepilin-type N-terminal cleavage/methylation domain-containing protein/prepilin-type processing-associated H-X9-DG protein